MNIASTVFRNIASNYGGLVLNLAITFFLSPFVVNSLGAAYFGIWALTMQFTGYMYILDFGVRDSIIRYTARYRGRHQGAKLNRLLTMSLAIYAPIALLAAIVTLVGAWRFPYWFEIDPVHASEARIAVALVGLTIAQGFLFNAFTGILQGLQRFDIANNIGVIGNASRAVLVVIAIKAGGGIVGLSLVQFVLAIVGSLVTTYYALALLKREGMPFVPSWVGGRRGIALMRRVFGYSAYVFINNVGQKVILASDAVVVGLFLPVAKVTYYAIAGNLINLLRSVILSAIWVLMPLASHYAAQRMFAEIRVLLIRASKGALLAALPICVGFFLMGRDFIGLWMGNEFAAEAAQVLVVLAIAEVFSAPHHAMSAILMGMNSHRTMALVRVGEAVANLSLSIFLVKRIGLPGVAWGTTIPHVFVMVFILPVLTCRAVNLPLRSYLLGSYLRPFVSVLPFAALVWAMREWWPPTNLVAFFLKMGLVVLPYLATVWVVALTREERAMVAAQLGPRLGFRGAAAAVVPPDPASL